MLSTHFPTGTVFTANSVAGPHSWGNVTPATGAFCIYFLPPGRALAALPTPNRHGYDIQVVCSRVLPTDIRYWHRRKPATAKVATTAHFFQRPTDWPANRGGARHSGRDRGAGSPAPIGNASRAPTLPPLQGGERGPPLQDKNDAISRVCRSPTSRVTNPPKETTHSLKPVRNTRYRGTTGDFFSVPMVRVPKMRHRGFFFFSGPTGLLQRSDDVM